MPLRGLFSSAATGDDEPDDDAGANDGGDRDGSAGDEPLSDFVKLLTAPNAGFFNADAPLRADELPAGRQPRVVEQPYRPVKRPPVALLTILDDGQATAGETVRIREPVCLIGRTEGSVVIPHDNSMSSRHAEIIRDGVAPEFAWYLRDAGSKNGTFVCCDNAPLRADRLLMLGSRRFRLQPPGDAAASLLGLHTASEAQAAADTGVPMLVETTVPVNPICIRLVGSRVTVGRPGLGNHVEIDDPLLASQHAVFTPAADGTWWVDAMPSRNGVWIQVRSVALADSCRFQCGEQRFLFVKP